MTPTPARLLLAALILAPAGCLGANDPQTQLRLIFASQPSDVILGTSINPAIQVSVVDPLGQLHAAGSHDITLSILDNPGGGMLAGTTTRSTTAGTATFPGLGVSQLGNGYTLAAAAGGFAGSVSAPFSVILGPPFRVDFDVQPSAIDAGELMSPAVTVRIRDIAGNTLPGATNGITLSLGSNPGASTLSGTLAKNAVAGVATFDDLSLNRPGNGYTLSASATGLGGDVSSAFSVSVGVPARLMFVVQPSTVDAGLSISPAVQVGIQDIAGNTVVAASDSVSLSLDDNPGGAVLSGTLTRVPVNGLATFDNLSLDQVAAGYTLAASAGTLAGATSDPFEVTADTTPPAAITNLWITQVTDTGVSLQWTAPGDDGTIGQASSYDIRYSPTAFDEGTWDSAIPATGEPSPSVAGSTESFAISGLAASSTVYVAIRSTDDSTNVSPISNVVWTRLFTPAVAFVSNKTPGNEWALFSTPIDGSFQVQLSLGVPYATNIWDQPFNALGGYAWSPDGRMIAFLADTSPNGSPELYVVTASGGDPVKVSMSLGNVTVREFSWSPDSSWIAYTAWTNGSTVSELFVGRPDGTGKKKVSGVMSGISGVLVNNGPSLAWAPDSSRIAYAAEQDAPLLTELYSVHPDGTSNVKISGGTVKDVIRFSWSPDGGRLAFVSYTGSSPSVYDLYTTLPDSPASCVLITAQLRNNALRDYRWRPDGSRIAYLNYTPATELWSALPDGTDPVKLSPTLPGGGQIDAIEWSPNGSYLGYRAIQDTATLQLYTAPPAAAGGTIRVSTPGGVSQFSWAPDSSRLAYANQGSPYTIHTTLPTSSLSDIAVTPPNISPIFGNLRWAPSSARIAYVYQSAYTALADSAAGHAQVSPSGVPGSGVALEGWAWKADGSKLFYLADLEVDGSFELYVTDSDTSANNLRISGPLQAQGAVASLLPRP